MCSDGPFEFEAFSNETLVMLCQNGDLNEHVRLISKMVSDDVTVLTIVFD